MIPGRFFLACRIQAAYIPGMNILFITADQWRGNCLSALHHPIVKTPVLDALAAEGTLFRAHYAQATPCAPSRTSLHTGMYLFNHRCVANGTPVSRNLTNWALEVRKAGYAPSLFGYSDTAADPSGLSPADPRLKHYSEPLPGIGDYTPFSEDVCLPWVEFLLSRGYDIPPKRWDLLGKRVPGMTWGEGGDHVLPLDIRGEDHETAYLVRRCMEWIAAMSGPWITHLSLLRPHPPFVAPAPYNAMYPPEQIAQPLRRRHRNQEAAVHPYVSAMMQSPRYGDDGDLRELEDAWSSYYGLMTEVDEHLGRLFEFLRSTNQWDDTLVIFTSDHGEQLGDHWLLGKLGFFDQSYHVPLIVRDPRVRSDANRGRQLDLFTENVDIMPTMLDWLDLDIPSQCDGRSLLEALRASGTPPGWRDAVHWEHDFRHDAEWLTDSHPGTSQHSCHLAVIRDNQFKYVHFAALPPLLYDLEQDPGEFDNVAGNPGYAAVRLLYAEKLLQWRMRYTARGLTETMLTPDGPVSRAAPP